MAIIFTDGWESGNFNGWSGAEVSGVGVTMTADAVAARRGIYGCKISGLTENVAYGNYGICRFDLPTPRSFLYTRLYVKFTQELSAGMLYLIQHGALGGGTNHACLVREATGEYKWLIEVSDDLGTISDYAGAAFNGPIAGKWYCLELYTYKSATVGQVTMWVDEVQVINQTGINTGDLPITELRAEAWHIWGNPNVGTVYLDDVVGSDAYIGSEAPITGVLSVTASMAGSSVGAGVSVGGQAGTTPVSFSLAAGTYTVTATYAGTTLTQSATVVAGQTTTINFDFSVAPNLGFITVNAYSDGTVIAANVTADGQTGTTPVTFSFPVGTYNITATYQGQTLPAQQVVVVAGQTSIVNLHFVAPVTHSLIITSSIGGTTNPVPGRYDYNEGSSAVITAIVNADYRFSYWMLEGTTRTENPVTIVMDMDYSLRAIFEALPPPPPQKRYLTIVAINGGQTDPTPNTYEVDLNSTVTITATPNSGYKFKEWLLDNVQAGTQPFITVTMDANHTVVAMFEETVTPPVVQAGFPLWVIPVALIGIGAVYVVSKKK